jgi:hypothetical protein
MSRKCYRKQEGIILRIQEILDGYVYVDKQLQKLLPPYWPALERLYFFIFR